METVSIPGIGKPISRIGLGTWAMGGYMWGGVDESRAAAAITRALDMGITLIDTAPAYGFGFAEELVGRVLADTGRREHVVVASTCGLEWDRGPIHRNAQGAQIECDVDGSLRRLRVEQIDLYLLHWPDPLVPIEESAAALVRLQKQGKVGAIGVGNASPSQLDRFSSIARISVVETPFNLFEREASRDVIPWCRAHNVAVFAYCPLCRGLLTGRMRSDTWFPGDDLRTMDPKFRQPRFGQYLEAVRMLEKVARESGHHVLELAMRWVLDQPGVSAALWGVRGPDQLAAVPRAFGWHLSPMTLDRIDELLAACIRDPIGPEFMAPPARQPPRMPPPLQVPA